MSKVRGIRFTESEERLVDEFLKSNSFFDFTTLAKIAILEFIKKPQINFTPVGHSKKQEAKNVRSN